MKDDMLDDFKKSARGSKNNADDLASPRSSNGNRRRINGEADKNDYDAGWDEID